MTYPNGDLYSGHWHANQRSGFGRLQYARGDVFEGEWSRDTIHGRGVLRQHGGKRVEGEWRDGELVQEVYPSPLRSAG